ncbi:MAG: hypothetical protein L3J23_07340 [Flavobacteriaceae bacterium]|nr:hypothetical protein [Flavobacteriaceae bacterium]
MYQFLLTTKKIKSKYKSTKIIGFYNLYYGEKLNVNSVLKKNIEIHLLGDFYDWENPKSTNQQIINNLVTENLKIEDLLLKTNKYSGEFIIIFIKNTKCYLFNDACSQREIYYSDDFSSFGSQLKLFKNISKAIKIRNKDENSNEYYFSDVFKKNKLHIGNKTNFENIKHLMPNHFIDISKKKEIRFFPVMAKIEIPLDIVAKKASIMLKGYLKAISLRKKMILGVTAGYDSRVLFLASLGLNCKYYVNKTNEMNDNHYDIIYAKKLTAIYRKKLNIIEKDFNQLNTDTRYKNSVDFPRFLNIGIETKDNEIVINGNISEIARNFYGYHKNATSKDLSFLSGKSNQEYAIKEYDKWLKNKIEFTKLGYNYLDMFYWEEKMGIWQAKAKTESYALNRNVTTPYNSRDLLTLLLSTKRKYRDSHFNKLYDKIIFNLSNNNKSVKKLPINLSKRTIIIRLLKRFGLYNWYREIGVKTQKLKIG